MEMIVSEMKEAFWRELHEKHEAVCLCCQRRARINKLSIHSTLALMLARLYYRAQPKDAWVHINQFRPAQHSSGRDFCIVKHWGLAEAMPAKLEEDKNSSGNWRLTPAGIAFVENKMEIPVHAFVLDDRVISFSEEKRNIEGAIKKVLSYAELQAHINKPRKVEV